MNFLGYVDTGLLEYLGIFVISWVLGLVAGMFIWRRGRYWPRGRRVCCEALAAAIFCTPSVLGGHGGGAAFPGLVALAIQPGAMSVYFYAIFFGPMWLLCLAVSAVLDAFLTWLLY